MSRSQKKTWRVSDTWRKLGYLYYNDSREFRRVIDINQSFDIRTEPAQGVEIYTSFDGVSKSASTNNGTASQGTLSQADIALDLRNPTNTTNLSETSVAIWPWDSYSGYVNRLAQYSAPALLDRDRVNGFSLDSPQANGESQRG